jgi:5-methylcytosine-specific restriction protein B
MSGGGDERAPDPSLGTGDARLTDAEPPPRSSPSTELDPNDVRSARLRPEHPLERVAHKTGRSLELLQSFVRAIERKGQAVLYGPPGTGKSYLARELARHLVGGTDGFTRQLVLHASTTYEDFVQGYRPVLKSDGTVQWPLVRGRVVVFAEESARRDGPCVLVLDEMQRADVPRVLGELVHLLEYRGEPMPLGVGEMPFLLPHNVRVIGTLSTSDPHTAAADQVLRRRFAFLRITADLDVVRRFHRSRDPLAPSDEERIRLGFSLDGLIAVLSRIDHTIGDADRALGITYFLRPDLGAELEEIWRFEVEPMLELLLPNRAELARFRWDAVRHKLEERNARG